MCCMNKQSAVHISLSRETPLVGIDLPHKALRTFVESAGWISGSSGFGKCSRHCAGRKEGRQDSSMESANSDLN